MVKKTGIPVKGFKLSKDNKVERDYNAEMAKLDLCKRIARKKSKRIKVIPRVPHSK